MRFSLRILLLVSLIAAPGGAQSFTPTALENNTARARAVMQRALAAHRVRNVDSLGLSAEWQGIHTSVLQNLEPDFTKNPLPRSARIARIAGGSRALYEERLARPGVYTGWHRYLVNGQQATDVNLNSVQYRPTQARQVHRRVREMMPALLLLEAARVEPVILPSADSTQDAVLVTLPDGARHALYFDRATGLLARFETVATLPLIGEKSWEVRFTDYRSVSGVPVPWIKLTRLSGALAESLVVTTARIGADAAPSSTFELPATAQPVDNNAERQAVGTRITRLSERVLQISGIGGGDATVIAAAVGDTVILLGAPGGISDSVLTVVASQFPGKVARYVVPTHHHFDHAGGLPAYRQRGLTVLTTPGNESFFRGIDRQPPTSSAIRVMRVKHVFGTGEERIEIHDIGPTPHAREMLVAYIPALELLYQGDLLELDDNDPITSTTANEVTPSLLAAIEKLGLPVRHIVGTEGRTGSLDDLRLAVSLMPRRWE